MNAFDKLYESSLVSVFSEPAANPDDGRTKRIHFQIADRIYSFSFKLYGKILDVTKIFVDETHGTLLMIRLQSGPGGATDGYENTMKTFFIVKKDMLTNILTIPEAFYDSEKSLQTKSTIFENNGQYYCLYQAYWRSSYKKSVDTVYTYVSIEDLFKSDYSACFVRLPFIGNYDEANDQFYLPLNDSNINLRENPGVQSKVLGKLSGKERIQLQEILPGKVTLNGFSGFWIKVTTSELEGWIWSQFVQQKNPPPFDYAGTMTSPSSSNINVIER